MTVAINKNLARKVLKVVDAGLCSGVGNPKPGEMCVEAAVCYAMGLPHGDNPSCVSPALRRFKIGLNDASWSSNEARARGLRKLAVAQLGSARVLDDAEFSRRLAERVIRVLIPRLLEVVAELSEIKEPHRSAMKASAKKCEAEGSQKSAEEARAAAYAAHDDAYACGDAAYAAYACVAAAARDAAYAAHAAAYAAHDAARAATYAAHAAAYAAHDAARAAASKDGFLTLAADLCIEVLREMKAPGIKWVDELCN